MNYSFIYFSLLLFFLLPLLSLCHLVEHSIPSLPNNITTSQFSPNHISDNNHNTIFSTGTIHPYSNYPIIYNLSHTHYISEIVILWLYNPFLFKIGLSNFNHSFNYIYYNQLTPPDEYSSYSSNDLETVITNIGYGQYIDISIINNQNTYNNVLIRDIEIQGFNVHTQLISISPNYIPINSNPQFELKFHENIPITYSLTPFCNISTTYFNTPGTYYTCYLSYKQSPNISVIDITSISPNTIHASSFTKLIINTSQPLFQTESMIGLNDDCSNVISIKSISNIYYNSIDFFEQFGETGTFPICLSINNIWGKTNLYIHIVIPIIHKVSGCTDILNYTQDCNTIGGNTIHIYGENFFNYYNNPIISYDNIYQYNNTIISPYHIKSILPEGYGHNISIKTIFEIESEDKHLLSYSKPFISYLSGCTPHHLSATNCPNHNSFLVHIIGNNFGRDSSTILIGSNMCNNITHHSHSNISCVLDGSRGINNVVYVIQNRGEISEGKKLLSYRECPIGHEIVDGNCITCQKGYYKNTISDTTCILCSDGYYTNERGSNNCKTCQDNSFSNRERTSCICREGYFMSENGVCEECLNTDFFGNTIYLCKETGLTIQSLQNNDGYWRSNPLTTDFYKCKLEDYCPMNCIINNSVICYPHHTGILCHLCEPGYAKDNNGFCQECTSSGTSTYTILSFTILSYIALIIISLIYGNKHLNNKLDINYNNEEEEEEEEEEEDDLGSIMDLQQKLKIVLSYIQISTILSVNLNIKWPVFMKKVVDSFKVLNLDMFDFIGLDYRCSTSFDYYHIFIFQMFMIPILFSLTALSYFLTKYWGLYKNKESEFFTVIHNRFIYLIVLITFIMYPSISNTILRIYKCEEIDGNWYLSSDLSIGCFDETWNSYAISSVFLIILYIIGIPLYFYHKLRKLKNKEKLEDETIIYRYGFMFMGYKDEMWWFEILELTRKTILSATIIYLDESPTRIVISMFICLLYLLYITYKNPLKDLGDDFLAILSGTELVLILFCAIILEMKINIQDKYDEVGFNIFLFTIYTTVIIIGNYQLIRGLAKHKFFHILITKIKKLLLYKWIKKIYNLGEDREEDENIRTLTIIRETTL
jgi:hypothetical protein